jgi:hypothetical protein
MFIGDNFVRECRNATQWAIHLSRIGPQSTRSHRLRYSSKAMSRVLFPLLVSATIDCL